MSRDSLLGTGLLLVVVAMALPPIAGAAADGRDAAFERFRTLEGRWIGESTKGWTSEVNVRTIAGGTVVSFSSFDAHPGETMMTMVHRDGHDVVLTHYCIAGNQPRLEATGFADEGRQLTFTYRDGTNLPSRDEGHMDKVVYRFHDDGHFTSRWTWYQDGKESWMEEIRYRRTP